MSSTIQSILFSRKERYGWTPSKARELLANSGFRKGKLHTTADYYRFRQAKPSGYKRMRTIWLSRKAGIKAVVGYR